MYADPSPRTALRRLPPPPRTYANALAHTRNRLGPAHGLITLPEGSTTPTTTTTTTTAARTKTGRLCSAPVRRRHTRRIRRRRRPDVSDTSRRVSCFFFFFTVSPGFSGLVARSAFFVLFFFSPFRRRRRSHIPNAVRICCRTSAIGHPRADNRTRPCLDRHRGAHRTAADDMANSDDPFKEGYLCFPPHGVLSQLKVTFSRTADRSVPSARRPSLLLSSDRPRCCALCA